MTERSFEPAKREIRVAHGPGSTRAGREERFVKNVIRIGRRPDNDVCFDSLLDRKVGGYHAEVYVDDDKLHVRDLGSANGTFVNGRKLVVPVALGADDVVQVGETGPELRLSLVVSGDGAQEPRPERSIARLVVVMLSIALVGGILLLLPARNPWPALADRYERSVFLIPATTNGRLVKPLGTAFCVRADGLLATNAHVARAVGEDPGRYSAIQAGTGRVYSIRETFAHPDFDPASESPDVGLISIVTSGTALTPLPIASDDDLGAVERGRDIGTLGFPNDSDASAQSPPATFTRGEVSKLEAYDLRRHDDFSLNRLLEHNMTLTPGCSGSPIFSADGKVVAIAKSWSEGGGKGWAIRVDVLRAFMASKGYSIR